MAFLYLAYAIFMGAMLISIAWHKPTPELKEDRKVK